MDSLLPVEVYLVWQQWHPNGNGNGVYIGTRSFVSVEVLRWHCIGNRKSGFSFQQYINCWGTKPANTRNPDEKKKKCLK